MSDNDKKDLTRIEDLSEFLHSEEDDDLSDIEAALSTDNHAEENAAPVDDEFSDMATDPDIKIPENFQDDGMEADFSALEDSEEGPEEDNFADNEDSFTDSDDFNSSDDFADEGDFGQNDEFEPTEDFSSEDDVNSSDDFEQQNNFEQEDDFSSSADFSDTQEDEFEQEENFGQNDDFEQTSDFSSDDHDVFQSDDEFETPELPDNIPDENIEDIEEQTLPPLPAGAETETQIHEEEQEEQEEQSELPPETKTVIAPIQKEGPYQGPENFKELQHFARNMSFGNMAKEGNPPFSIILKDIKYEEDVDDIIRLLIEYKIVNEEDRDNARSALARGNMLIPRLGEFAAISLCHKLRRFDINILMGLTEEVSPAKDYESDDRGLTTKHNIYNNKQHSWKFEKQDLSIKDVIVTTTPFIEGYDILEYIAVVTESATIDMENFAQRGQLQEQINLQMQGPENSAADYYPFHKENSSKTSEVSLNDIYHSLVEKCKAHAIDKKGNALIGINFQITPLITDDPLYLQTRYQITCSGNIVWINKR